MLMIIEPWIFQRPVKEYSTAPKTQPLQNEDTVFIRDIETEGFLTVEEKHSILDRFFTVEMHGGPRFEVRYMDFFFFSSL
jgi:hypothetical protein